MYRDRPGNLVPLDVSSHLWDRFFNVAPLVLIGTMDPDGAPDLAPKHMVTPMGWDNYFGFVCAPTHSTYSNIERTGVFTISYPRPSQLLYTALAASPRCGEGGHKPGLDALPLFRSQKVDGVLLEDAYIYLECEHFRTVDGFGVNSLITGTVVAASAQREVLRSYDRDDQELLHDAPLLVYLHPGRFATVEQSYTFPVPAGMKK